MSFADLILRRPLWEQVAQKLQLPLLEGAEAPHLYDRVAQLMHGAGARFPNEAQKQVEQTAERMKGLIDSAGHKSRVLGAIVSVLLPTSFAIAGERGGLEVAVVPDHLAPSVHRDNHLLLAVFQATPLALGLEMVPHESLFEAVRTLTKEQDVDLGLPNVVVRGTNAEAIRTSLGRPEVGQALTELLALESGTWLVNDRGALLTMPSGALLGGDPGNVLDRLVKVVGTLAS